MVAFQIKSFLYVHELSLCEREGAEREFRGASEKMDGLEVD